MYLTKLYTNKNERKYLNPAERIQFLNVAKNFDSEIESFCVVLAMTGCRISEALALKHNDIDLSDEAIIFKSLKKRRNDIYRAVPITHDTLHLLTHVHRLRDTKKISKLLWPWSRSTAWRHVKSVYAAAGLTGAKASPKGLRHGFGILAITKGIQLNILQKWLGHTSLTTTAIYADALGEEQKILINRMFEI